MYFAVWMIVFWSFVVNLFIYIKHQYSSRSQLTLLIVFSNELKTVAVSIRWTAKWFLWALAWTVSDCSYHSSFMGKFGVQMMLIRISVGTLPNNIVNCFVFRWRESTRLVDPSFDIRVSLLGVGLGKRFLVALISPWNRSIDVLFHWRVVRGHTFPIGVGTTRRDT